MFTTRIIGIGLLALVVAVIGAGFMHTCQSGLTFPPGQSQGSGPAMPGAVSGPRDLGLQPSFQFQPPPPLIMQPPVLAPPPALP